MKFVVDLGGTNTRVAVSKDGKNIFKKVRFKTFQSFSKGVSHIVDTIHKFGFESASSELVIGVAGTVDHQRGSTILVPNAPSWSNKSVCQLFKEKLKIHSVLMNDAELAALGEANHGAGKQYRIVAYITVSTGIGGALVVDKRLVPRVYNSEPGHMKIDFQSKWEDETGRKGTLEALASGSSFEKHFGEKSEMCKSPETWARYAEILAEGLMNVIMLWSPEVMVIGGGLAQSEELLFKPLKEYIASNLIIFSPPKIVRASLGDDAGLYGGLAYRNSTS